jgi:hypothetical protein
VCDTMGYGGDCILAVSIDAIVHYRIRSERLPEIGVGGGVARDMCALMV